MKLNSQLDIQRNRLERKWTLSELFARGLWEVARGPLFAWSPRPFWAWRRFILRLFGAKIGKDARIHPTVRIAVPWTLEIGEQAAVGDGAILYALGRIYIGDRATISQYAHLCAGTHDYNRRDMRLVKASIDIGADAWICADAFIGPDVSIGHLAIVGARAVVTDDVANQKIVVGNPARVVGERPEMSE
jgi:putative colanic acid biosynthesis acetyltransferase WcaF